MAAVCEGGIQRSYMEKVDSFFQKWLGAPQLSFESSVTKRIPVTPANVVVLARTSTEEWHPKHSSAKQPDLLISPAV